MKMRGLVKLLLMRNSRRSMKIYNPDMCNYYTNHACPRNHNSTAAVHSCFITSSFNSITQVANSSCYLQTAPFSSSSDPHHGAMEETKGEVQVIEKGDVININDLLFTEHRDYLVKYNDDQQVKAAHLAGKLIVLYFVPLLPDYSFSRSRSSLIDTYTYLLPDNNFEVVLVAYGTAQDKILSDSHTNSKKTFEAIFSCMPWTAIPFSDIPSREHLASRFGIGWPSYNSAPVVIDSSGMVLQSVGCNLFEQYGGLGYPFSDEWIQYLETQDAATAKKPSLKALLGTPKRNYVISNKGEKVVIDTLVEKVVALYFYEEGTTPTWVTANIKEAYKEFALNKSCFEVVLIYLYDTEETLDRTSEETFCSAFETMPWLAIPFKDPKCERLVRFFDYPTRWTSPGKAPTLVIFGPHGEFIEPWGADIMHKFKLPAYPFTRERVAKLYVEKIRELSLEMLWEKNTIFRRNDESKVRFSELVGKKVILFFEGNDGYRQKKVVGFLRKLKESYFDMKGTSDEFEVIYITSGDKESPYKLHIADLPCFVSPASDLLPVDLSLYRCYCHLWLAPGVSSRSCDQCGRVPGHCSTMLSFDQYGRVVRKSSYLFDDSDFLFCGNMEQEALYELIDFYYWGWDDKCYEGLRINSYGKNENLPYIYRSKFPEEEYRIR